MTTTTRKTTESNKSGLPADSCVFCRIVAGTEPATVVREWEDAIAFSPRHPVTPGHLLVVPRTHVADAVRGRPPDATASPPPRPPRPAPPGRAQAGEAARRTPTGPAHPSSCRHTNPARLQRVGWETPQAGPLREHTGEPHQTPDGTWVIPVCGPTNARRPRGTHPGAFPLWPYTHLPVAPRKRLRRCPHTSRRGGARPYPKRFFILFEDKEGRSAHS